MPRVDPILFEAASSLVDLSDNKIDTLEVIFRTVQETSVEVFTKSRPEAQEAVKRIDDDIEASLPHLRQGKVPPSRPKTVVEVHLWLLVRNTWWLGEPRRIHNHLETFKFKKSQKLLDSLSPDARLSMELMLAVIVSTSLFRSREVHKGEGDMRGKRQFLILGKPGVGKSHFINELLVICGIKVIEVDQRSICDQYKAKIAPNILNCQVSSGVDTLPGTPDTLIDYIGILNTKTRESGIKNPVFVFHEFSFPKIW